MTSYEQVTHTRRFLHGPHITCNATDSRVSIEWAVPISEQSGNLIRYGLMMNELLHLSTVRTFPLYDLIAYTVTLCRGVAMRGA
jgi:hypothetical protein